jgi:hypothetical protein
MRRPLEDAGSRLAPNTLLYPSTMMVETACGELEQSWASALFGLFQKTRHRRDLPRQSEKLESPSLMNDLASLKDAGPML